MKKIAFFDAKPYDRTWFDQLNQHYHIKYYEHKLTPDTISLAHGCEAVIPFVNDTLDRTVIDGLCQEGIKMIALRCAGYNNVDRDAARGRIPVVRVPGYSPYAVAEFTMGLLLTLNRKIHKAYFRTRDFNFSLNGLVGFDLHGRTVGVIGTGKIGQIFIRICQGFGMHVLAYDPYPVQDAGFPYVSLEELLAKSDIISLHCPLTEQTRHLINRDTIAQMKDGQPVWFGCDVGKHSERDSGIMDLDIRGLEDLLDTRFTMTKAERLDYGQSLMTHAMVFQGVNLDENGKPNRWRVENSWGKEPGKDGYYLMTDRWFDEYMYQVVVNKKYLTAEQIAAYEAEPIALEPWDPMGSLAVVR